MGDHRGHSKSCKGTRNTFNQWFLVMVTSNIIWLHHQVPFLWMNLLIQTSATLLRSTC